MEDKEKIEELENKVKAFEKEREVWKEDKKQLEEDIKELRSLNDGKKKEEEKTFRDYAKALMEGVE